MSRIINPDGVGQQRTRLCKAVMLTLRELAAKQDIDDEARDMAAFISLCLREIYATVDVTVRAWEKRDYWVKADRFRRDWAWSQTKSEAVRQSVLCNDWGELAQLLPEIAAREQLVKIKLPKRNTIGSAWEGAFQRLREVQSES
ncbi:MAG: hypothetical protein ACE5FI_00685 [Anaerolineales bacterium]